MALVGQIVTVSDVLMDGTVNNYIMGADANVFQTNYNSSGVMTNWSIGDITNGTRMQGDSSSFLLDTWNGSYRVQRIQANNSTIVLGESSSTTNAFFILGQQNAQLACDAISFNLSRRDFSLRSVDGIVQIVGSAGTTSNYLYFETPGYAFNMSDNIMSIGPKIGSNYINYSGNSRPYFGGNSSNYVISNYDLQYGLGHHEHNDLYNSDYYVYATIGGHAGIDNHQFSVVDKRDGDSTVFSSSINRFSLICGDNQYTSSVLGQNSNEGLYLSYSNGTIYSNINITDSLVFRTAGNYTFSNIETQASGLPALFVGDNLFRQSSSSRRYKNSINNLKDSFIEAERLYNLPVRQFKYNNGVLKEDDPYYDKLLPGFIAEEVNEYYPNATVYNKKEDGQLEVENWDVRYIVPPMLKLIQDQHQEIELLKEEVTNLKKSLSK